VLGGCWVGAGSDRNKQHFRRSSALPQLAMTGRGQGTAPGQRIVGGLPGVGTSATISTERPAFGSTLRALGRTWQRLRGAGCAGVRLSPKRSPAEISPMRLHGAARINRRDAKSTEMRWMGFLSKGAARKPRKLRPRMARIRNMRVIRVIRGQKWRPAAPLRCGSMRRCAGVPPLPSLRRSCKVNLWMRRC